MSLVPICFKPFPMGVSLITFLVYFSIPIFFPFSHSAAFFVKHFQEVFQCVFFYKLWTLSNSTVAVTNDTFNKWFSLLAKFTLYCCDKVSSQVIFEANVEFFLLFFNCSQLCFSGHFYFTVKQEKIKQNIMITKWSYLKFQEDFKIKCLYFSK